MLYYETHLSVCNIAMCIHNLRIIPIFLIGIGYIQGGDRTLVSRTRIYRTYTYTIKLPRD